MGTRHLIAVIVDGQPKMAQYGQWDGYPSGQGQNIVDFLRSADLDLFTAHMRAAHIETEDERNARYTEAGHDGGQWVRSDVSERIRERWPHLTRDSGAETLPYILATAEPVLQGSEWEFGNDSLFCEWAYVVDLDERVFEVYKGFQHAAHNEGRWASGTPKPCASGDNYYPVRMVAKWAIGDIPDDWRAQADPDEDDAAAEVAS